MKKYICTLLAIITIIVFFGSSSAYAQSTVNRGTVSTSGGDRTVTWVEIDLNAGYEVRAMSAQDTFGRRSAGITEFANAIPNRGEDTIIFPVNFFITATFEIVGAIYSQGRVVSSDPYPYLNWGVGFTNYNRMSLFSGRLNGNNIYGYHWDCPRLDYVTAFNAYPHLIRDGQRLDIQPMPGMTQAWMDGRVQRAFMGQRADGTLVVGNVGGTNIRELQDIAEYFNLVNATNIDGGASAGIWRNGNTVTAPGRQLAAVMVITSTTAESPPPPTPTTYVNNLPFVDIQAKYWSISAIRYVYERGIMNGTSETTFAPNISLSRAMVVTILHRLENEIYTPFRHVFNDVRAGQWYSTPTIWAYDAGIAQGAGDGRFAPQDSITREQLAAMIFRFARDRGYGVNVPTTVNSPFIDMNQISSWASEYVRWAIYNEFITPTTTGGNQLNPGTAASRAETAYFVHQFSVRFGR